MNFLAEVLSILRPNANWAIMDGVLEWRDDTQPQPTEDEIKVEIARLQAEYDAKQYQRDRAKYYPPIEDQLDVLYHEGIDGWKERIQAVKDKYPKPE
jgi:hypothetical protein